MRLLRSVLLVLSALLLVTLPQSPRAWAQAGTASLSGTVTDEQSAALPGVTVTGSTRRRARSAPRPRNSTGAYQFLALPPGTTPSRWS